MENKLKNLPSSYQNDINMAIKILKENGATFFWRF